MSVTVTQLCTMSDLRPRSEAPDPQGAYCCLLFHKMDFMSIFHCYPENNSRELEVTPAIAWLPSTSLPLRIFKSTGPWASLLPTWFYLFCQVTNGSFHLSIPLGTETSFTEYSDNMMSTLPSRAYSSWVETQIIAVQGTKKWWEDKLWVLCDSQ